ncbi:hypothetical protein D3C71_1347900 [compost metagenome]
MGEVHVVEPEIAAIGHRPWSGRRRHGRLFAAQLHDPAEADGHPLNRHVEPEQALYRPHGHPQVGGKRDQRTELPGALHHPVSADQKGAGPGQRGQRARHGLGEKLGDLQAQQLAHVALPQRLEAPRFALLLAGGLDEFHHRQCLDHERRHVRRTLAQLPHIALDLAPHPAQPEDIERDQYQG